MGHYTPPPQPNHAQVEQVKQQQKQQELWKEQQERQERQRREQMQRDLDAENRRKMEQTKQRK